MTISKLMLPMVALIGLSACMSGTEGVTRAKTGVTSCPEFGAYTQYITGGDLRCGPRAVLPYTLQ